MWIKRQKYCLYFNRDDLREIKMYSNIFKIYYIIIYLKDKKITFCKSKNYYVIYNIFELLTNSIENNKAISIDIPYSIKNDILINNKN